ncbi:hypothetical protein KI387_043477 [Taxus chinensis]|uniref:BHLH domain-containing protein n=1 Tax=Taxus chinensis TaxID=29808 RepID=A0AA38BYE7_TAXCH|nr:hypothetical protein KI387_043477 [Taxus chinensis]
MDCWFEQQQVGRSMSTFAERQAALTAQLLTTGSGSCLNFDQSFCPGDLPLIQQEQKQFDTHSAPICAYDLTDDVWPQCELTDQPLGFEPLPCENVAMPVHTVFPVMTEDEIFSPLSLTAWQTEPGLSDHFCSEPPAKRPRIGSFYTLEDVMEKLPRTAPSLRLQTEPLNIPPSDLNLSPPKVVNQHLFPMLQNFHKLPYASVEPQSVAARHRRTKIREKIRSLEKLVPLGSKLDTARMLEESIKYVKFLQAQVQILECMPHADPKAYLKSNPPKDNMNFCRWINASRGGGWSASLANALPLHDPASGFKFSMNKLSAQQMLHTLLTSSTIQRKLFSAGKVIGTVCQKELFAAVQPDFSIFLSD